MTNRQRLRNRNVQMISGIMEAGVDEVGRGCMAGPVVAAAVILPENFIHKYLQDSKKITDSQRRDIDKIIKEKAIAWNIAFIDNEIIDEINILQSTFLAMNTALSRLAVRPEHILIDGNRFKYMEDSKFDCIRDIPYDCVVKGDDKYGNISAASIIAKVARDDYMIKFSNQYPEYNWYKNKGYGTAEHIDAIHKYGYTPLHRMTFRLPDKGNKAGPKFKNPQSTELF